MIHETAYTHSTVVTLILLSPVRHSTAHKWDGRVVGEACLGAVIDGCWPPASLFLWCGCESREGFCCHQEKSDAKSLLSKCLPCYGVWFNQHLLGCFCARTLSWSLLCSVGAKSPRICNRPTLHPSSLFWFILSLWSGSLQVVKFICNCPIVTYGS